MQISEMLAGGDPRSLGKTGQVVESVLSNRTLLDELFNCIFQSDEIVRMRASDALEKICRQNPEWFEPYISKLLEDVPKIRQASVQWHLVQMLSEINLSSAQKSLAIDIMKRNLQTIDDWIVINLTLESLSTFARHKSLTRDEFISILRKFQNNRHKSVASRVKKLLKEFSNG